MQSTVIMSLGPGRVVERFTVTESDLTAAGTTQTITLKSLPKGTLITGVRVKTKTAFTGGGQSSLTVSVGSAAGSATTFSAAYDIFQAVADITFQATSMFKAATYAADTLQAFFTANASCVAFTAGEVWIDVEYILPMDLTGTASGGNL